MNDLTNLRQFLVKAKKATYATGDENQQIKEADHSTALVFTEVDWKYHDNYFGGEPYGGREVVFFKGKPLYIMTYYGQVHKTVKDIKILYGFLQKALSLIPEDKPFRGPQEFSEKELSYTNTFEGEIDDFSGEEIIKQNGQEIYRAKYIGGLVDQRE